MNSGRGISRRENSVEAAEPPELEIIEHCPDLPVSVPTVVNIPPLSETEDLTFLECALMIEEDRSPLLALMVMYTVLIADYVKAIGLTNARKVFNWSIARINSTNYAAFVNAMSSVVMLQSIKCIFLGLIESPYEIKISTALGGTLIQRPTIFKVLKKLGIMRSDTFFEVVPGDMKVKTFFTSKSGKFDEKGYNDFISPHFAVSDWCQFVFNIPKSINAFETRYNLVTKITAHGVTKQGKKLDNRTMTIKLSEATTLVSLSILHNTTDNISVLPNNYQWGEKDFSSTILSLLSHNFSVDIQMLESILPRVMMWNNHSFSDISDFSHDWRTTYSQFLLPTNSNFNLLPYGRTTQHQTRFVSQYKNVEIQRFLIPRDLFKICMYLPLKTPSVMYFNDKFYSKAFILPSIENSESIVYRMLIYQNEAHIKLCEDVAKNRKMLRNVEKSVIELVTLVKKNSVLAPAIEPVEPSTTSDDDSMVIKCRLKDIQHVATKTFQIVDRVLCDDRTKMCPVFDRLDDLDAQLSQKLSEVDEQMGDLVVGIESMTLGDSSQVTKVSHDPPCLDGNKIKVDSVPSPNPLPVQHEQINEPSASPKRIRMSVDDGQENGISPPPEETIYESDEGVPAPINPMEQKPEAGKSAITRSVEVAGVLPNPNTGKSVLKNPKDEKRIYVVKKPAGKSAVNQVSAMVEIPVVALSTQNPVLQHTLQGMPVVQVPKKDAVLPGSLNLLVNAKNSGPSGSSSKRRRAT